MQLVDIKPAQKIKSRLKAVKVDSEQRLIPKNDKRKATYWLVNLGKKFTGTTKQRRYFETEAEAKEFIRATENAKKTRGHAAFDIPQALAVEALNLQKELAPYGASLTTAVRFYLRHGPVVGRKTVSELVPIYLLTKKRADYRRAQEIALGVFERDFGKKTAASIMPPVIEKWFREKGWQPVSERNYRRDLNMFFRWAVRKDHASGNPMDKLDRHEVKTKTPEIFTVDEARRVLEAAYLNPSLGLLPYYAVGLFSGVRIEELERVTWKMFDFEENCIRMPGEITKTGQPRMPEINPALRAAIENVAASGPIVSPVNLRKRREKIHSLAGIANKRNALRHSFSSYHASLYKDPGRLQLLLGQQTPSVLMKHYVQAAPQREAEKFFNLLPPYEAPKEGAAGAAPP
jgi:integrase